MKLPLKILLIVFVAVNLLLPLATFADTKEEYQQCIDNCYAPENINWTTAQYKECLGRCSTDFPNGAKEWGQSVSTEPIHVGSTNAANQTEKTKFTFTPNVAIGGLFTKNAAIPVDENLFPAYINAWFNLMMGVIGIVATIMIIWAGFKWLLARGDSGKISDAKAIIFSALSGMALALLSYTLMIIINPRLVNPSMEKFKPIDFPHTTAAMRQEAAEGTTPTATKPGSTTLTPSANKIPCNSDIDTMRAFTASYEGFDTKPWQEKNGSWTYGWGHNSTNYPTSVDKTTEDKWFADNYPRYQNEAARTYGSGWGQLDTGTQAVLTDIAYRGWHADNDLLGRVSSKIRSGDRQGAADLMLNSSDYGQNPNYQSVRNRAAYNAEIVKNSDQQAYLNRAQSACQ